MNDAVRISFMLMVLLMIMLADASGASGEAGAKVQKANASSENQSFSALDRVPQFLEELKKAGFSLHEGKIEYIDLVKQCCEGMLADTLANNPWPNAYLTLKNMTPESYPKLSYPSWIWQLGEDEAIVLVGQTPPPVAYFSYQTFMVSPPYDGNATPPPFPGIEPRMGIALGDTTNVATINTTNAEPFYSPIIYIITGNIEAERRVRAAALTAGYPDSIINIEAISPVIAPLGIGPSGSAFYLAQRNAMPTNQSALEDYIKYPPYRVFRVTPNAHLAADPEPVPVLRVRGTGRSEMDLYPALKRLRKAILKEYTGAHKELDTHVWWLPEREIMLEKPYVGLQRGQFMMGATRDTNYLATSPNFKLRNGTDEFVIVYGVNHQQTGKATYASFSLYADKDKWFGIGTTLNDQFNGSAQQYLGPDDPDADKLYAFKVARDCKEEAYCMQPSGPESFTDPWGVPYSCPDLNMDEDEMFLIFRNYMEPETNVSPDDNELLYDQAIYFGPYLES
ncbi:MAG: hypothetical protein A4E49_01362 [Methanosaeta sp. PtaU1.Bin112]|nr:MAG: hypothetical protein A4E49_01362 [Methanosaeta sp. PtaU1.Bin112]